MKHLITLLSLIPSLTMAGVCKDTSPLKAQYEDQKKWEQVELPEFKGSDTVSGWTDGRGNLHLGDVTGIYSAQAHFVVEPKKVDKYFVKACRTLKNDGRYLRASRIAERGHTYSLAATFFPELADAKNAPYEALETRELELLIDYKADALVNMDSDPEELKSKIWLTMKDQLDVTSKNRQYHFDLTNLDDFVCDVVRGKAKVSVVRRMYGDHPIVEREEEISKADTFRLYADWANSTNKSKSYNQALFTMGARMSALGQQDEIGSMSIESAFKLATKMIDPGQSTVRFLDLDELTCVAEQMTSYRKGRISHIMNTQIEVDSKSILGGGL